MYRVETTTQFRKDFKKAYKRGYNLDLLEAVVEQIADGKPLANKYNDHALTGNWAGKRECHITSDWLLIYQIDGDILVLTLTRTGSHSDLFE